MKLEKEQPGTRHSLVNGMEKIRENTSKPENLTPCPTCGEPSGSPEGATRGRPRGTQDHPARSAQTL